jgi:hypothetical protein
MNVGKWPNQDLNVESKRRRLITWNQMQIRGGGRPTNVVGVRFFRLIAGRLPVVCSFERAKAHTDQALSSVAIKVRFIMMQI